MIVILIFTYNHLHFLDKISKPVEKCPDDRPKLPYFRYFLKFERVCLFLCFGFLRLLHCVFFVFFLFAFAMFPDTRSKDSSNVFRFFVFLFLTPISILCYFIRCGLSPVTYFFSDRVSRIIAQPRIRRNIVAFFESQRNDNNENNSVIQLVEVKTNENVSSF
jgi:hypothetical protein